MKKQVKELSLTEYRQWVYENCDDTCLQSSCPFFSVNCTSWSSGCWVNHKELYSEVFLAQEVEIPESKGS